MVLRYHYKKDLFEVRFFHSSYDCEKKMFSSLSVLIYRDQISNKVALLSIEGLKTVSHIPELFIDWLSAEVEDWKECLEEMEEVIKELHEH